MDIYACGNENKNDRIEIYLRSYFSASSNIENYSENYCMFNDFNSIYSSYIFIVTFELLRKGKVVVLLMIESIHQLLYIVDILL